MSEAAASVSWMPALLFIAGGLVLGVFLVWWTRKKGPAPSAPAGEGALPVEVRDLEEKEAALLAQLEELEDTAGKYTPERLAAHRRRIEIEAAETLRELEAKVAAHRAERERRLASERPRGASAAGAGPAEAKGAGILVRHPALKGFLWGAGAMAALALLFFSVSRSTVPRTPGGELTGSVPGGGGAPSAAAPASPAEAQTAQALDARIQANPDDLDARLAKARFDLGRSDWMGAWNETQYVLKKSPGNPEALTYQALVRFAMGQPEAAIEMLNQALAKAPDLPDAYAILALVQAKSGHLDQARATIERGEAQLPEHRAMFEQMYTQLQEQAEAGGGEAGGAEEATAEPPPAAPAAPAAGGSVEVANGQARVSGVVDLAPGDEAPPGGVLFVFVRPAGETSGPPTAVRRFASPTFPLHFALGDGDSMMGQPYPDRLRIEARLDSDGNPMTQATGDLHAELDDQPLGASDLHLDLRR